MIFERVCYWARPCHLRCPPQLATPQPRPVLTGALDTTQPVLQWADTCQWPTAHRPPRQPFLDQRSRQRRFPAKSSLFPGLQVGDLLYVKSDRDKSRARDRYIIVSIDGECCFIKTFSCSQLKATSYKVKLAKCCTVPHALPPPSYQSGVPALDDDECEEIAAQPHRTCYVRPAQTLQPPPHTKASSKRTPPPTDTDLIPLSVSSEARP